MLSRDWPGILSEVHMDKQIVFTGAGCNAASWLVAVRQATDSPSKTTVPAGATWPFVKLTLDDDSATIRFAQIRKTVSPSTTSQIKLSKLGYIYFESKDKQNDFGFATLKINSLIRELKQRGFILNEASMRNLAMAKFSLFLGILIPLVFLTIIIIMSLLNP